MRTTTAVIGVIAAATAGMALAAPQGMAPYPGQTGGYAAPPPPNGAAMQEPGPSGNAVDAPRKRPTCVWTRRISGWTPVDDYQMVVTQGTKRYLVTFSGKCRAQKHEQAIRVSRHWGSCLSPGDSVDFVSPFGYGPGYYGSCMISKVELAPDRTAQR
jgi:hypothetical protein